MNRCFHPKNYSIDWTHEVRSQFSLQNGRIQAPKETRELAKRHVRFECHDCGFMAYYAAHNAPHWFPAKMAAVGTGFPCEEQEAELLRMA